MNSDSVWTLCGCGEIFKDSNVHVSNMLTSTVLWNNPPVWMRASHQCWSGWLTSVQPSLNLDSFNHDSKYDAQQSVTGNTCCDGEINALAIISESRLVFVELQTVLCAGVPRGHCWAESLLFLDARSEETHTQSYVICILNISSEHLLLALPRNLQRKNSSMMFAAAFCHYSHWRQWATFRRQC